MNHCKTIAIVNQKGGVGKTTSTVNLGVGLAQAGNRVLLVDDDPQHSLTISLGIRNAVDDAFFPGNGFIPDFGLHGSSQCGIQIIVSVPYS